MSKINITDELIGSLREYTFDILDQNSNINIYTNINRLYRIEKNLKSIIAADAKTGIDLKLLFVCNYIINIEQALVDFMSIDFPEVQKHLESITKDLKVKFGIEDELINKIVQIVSEVLPHNKKTLIEAKILADAYIMDFSVVDGRKHLKQLYEQNILKDLEISSKNWIDFLIDILENFEVSTNYGSKVIEPSIDKLKKELKKERKEIEHRKDIVLQKELKISDEEIKKLKKELSKINDKDDRGIQTLFRNTSKNHYTLNQMVDGKANIMITVNSIILSFIMSGFIGTYNQKNIVTYLPFILLAIMNLISITFAIIAIKPIKTQGNFTEEDIRNKKGNLLYFGNFHNMQFRDFEWGFMQMLKDKDYLYGAMIRDYYYQSQALFIKYKNIRISLNTFLIGISVAIITQGIIKFTEFLN